MFFFLWEGGGTRVSDFFTMNPNLKKNLSGGGGGGGGGGGVLE